MKSAGVVIGWNENLHILSPPWHMIGHPCVNGSGHQFSGFPSTSQIVIFSYGYNAYCELLWDSCVTENMY